MTLLGIISDVTQYRTPKNPKNLKVRKESPKNPKNYAIEPHVEAMPAKANFFNSLWPPKFDV
jgi:hypothetical protein